MTHASSTVTCTCQYCGEEFEALTHDSIGRKRTERQMAKSIYCSKPCKVKAGMRTQTEKRRAARGAPADVDGRTTRGLSPRTIELIDAVRVFLNGLSDPTGTRACCYHLLTIGLLKSTREFATAQAHITNARARDEGDNSLDDDKFEDRSRKLEYSQGWADGDEFLDTVRTAYSRDHWTNQPTVPIILCEKDGFFFLKSVTGPAHVRLFLSKGTHGRSHLIKLAEHVAELISAGKQVAIGYVGDFDADGVDMEHRAENGNDFVGTRSTYGVRQFLRIKHGIPEDTDQLTWERLGLTETQLLDLPTEARIAAKRTSNNFNAYAARHSRLFKYELFTRAELKETFPNVDKDGHEECEDYDGYVYGGEADALTADGMKELCRQFIEHCTMKKGLWKKSVAKEKAEKKALLELSVAL